MFSNINLSLKWSNVLIIVTFPGPCNNQYSPCGGDLCKSVNPASSLFLSDLCLDCLEMLILFGSETGNAQDVAEGIGREASFHGLQPRVMSMDSYPVQELPNEHLVILIAATTGQGDPPKKMKAFWKFLLRRSLQSDSLSGVACAVFGLGDSGYVKYNVVGKKLANRLAGLGAEMIIDKGLGDDQHPSGYEAELDPWLEKLWKALELRLGLQKPNGPRGLGDPKFQVEYLGKRDGKALKKPDLNSDLRMAAVAAASFREVRY